MKDKPKRPAEHKPISLREMVKRLLDMPPASTAKERKTTVLREPKPFKGTGAPKKIR